METGAGGWGLYDPAGRTGIIFYSVAFGNGRFVAVGDAGTIVYSSDGKSWQPAIGDASFGFLDGVGYGNGRFVAVGGDGTIVYSDDGISWQRVTDSGTSKYLVAVGYGNGRFVAVGETIVYSDDGISWQRVTDSVTSDWLSGVSYGNGRFVAVGWEGTIVYGGGGKPVAAGDRQRYLHHPI